QSEHGPGELPGPEVLHRFAAARLVEASSEVHGRGAEAFQTSRDARDGHEVHEQAERAGPPGTVVVQERRRRGQWAQVGVEAFRESRAPRTQPGPGEPHADADTEPADAAPQGPGAHRSTRVSSG